MYDEVASDDYDTVPDLPPPLGENHHPTENKGSGAKEKEEYSEHSHLCEEHCQYNADLVNDKLKDGAEDGEGLDFSCNKLNHMEEGVCEAILDDGDSLSVITDSVRWHIL